MTDVIDFYYDYTDPASYLLDTFLAEVTEERGLERVFWPVELRPPPTPLVRPDDRWWRSAWEPSAQLAADEGIPLELPRLIPWTRMAHALGLHAADKGCFPTVHRTLFQAHFVHGLDIGRVDVLVRLATEAGLDLTETKAVLDVDRYLERLLELQREAVAAGVTQTPAVRIGGRIIGGLTGRAELETLLVGG